MVGSVPRLGYDVSGPTAGGESGRSKDPYIFRRFAELGSSTLLVKELRLDGVRSKAWTTHQDGRVRAGTRPSTSIYKLARQPHLPRRAAPQRAVDPGVGTIFQLAATQLVFPPPPFVTPTSGAVNNDRGQVVFQATLTNGSGVFLLATPN